MMKKYAVIDIGSNSVRLMISTDGVTSYKMVETTRLGENLTKTGALSPAAMARTAQAVAEFCRHAREQEGVAPVLFATEAVRCASNREAFTELIYAGTGLRVDVLSGETEARIGFLGAVNGAPGVHAVLDIGGASTELAVGNGANLTYSQSVPAGVVRIWNECGERRELVEAYAKERLSAFRFRESCPALTGIGGTVTNLAAAFGGIVPYDGARVQGLTMTLSDVAGLEDKLYRSSVVERVALGIEPKRAELICGGATLLRLAMERFGADTLCASEADNLEGYLLLGKNSSCDTDCV